MCHIYEIQHMECTDICIINMHIDNKIDLFLKITETSVEIYWRSFEKRELKLVGFQAQNSQCKDFQK